MGALLPRTLLGAGLFILLLRLLCLGFRGDNLAILLFHGDDLLVLALGAVLLVALALWRPSLPRFAAGRPLWLVAGLALLVLLVCWAGTWLVFGGYALT